MAPISTTPEFSREEVGLALRNPGMQLEGLRYPITPIGMHYRVRATDAAGKSQPLDCEEVWNQGGYGINVVQRVPVEVG
jgi:hypothetical protein